VERRRFTETTDEDDLCLAVGVANLRKRVNRKRVKSSYLAVRRSDAHHDRERD
jgi:hypothetical protein